MSDVDIQLRKLVRDIAAEKLAGSRLLSAVVRVVYEHGSFELALQVDRWSDNDAEMQETLRKPLLAFAEALREAALGPIHIPKPPPPQTGR